MNDTGKAFVPQSQDDDDHDKEIRQHYTGGAAHTSTQATSTNAYGPHIETWGDGFEGVIGVSIDDVIYTSPDVTYVNNIYVHCDVGLIYIEVSYNNGVSWREILFTSVIDSTNVPTADDVELAVDEHTVLFGSALGTITNFRLRQKGATASNGSGRYGVK